MSRLMAIAVVVTNALFGTKAALAVFKWWCRRIAPK